MTVRELDARVATVMSEMRWHRWLLFVLLAATVSPKLGGPAAPAIAEAAVKLFL